VPQLVSYQGKLANASGQTASDGSYSMIFSLYDQETGGTQLWSESHEVQVTGGLFTVLLGSATPFSGSEFHGSTWLEIWVNRVPLSPRIHIVSAGYAIRSGVAETVPDDSITSAKLASDAASLGKVSGGAMASTSGRIEAGGELVVDRNNQNSGAMGPGLLFGYPTGEGISSKRIGVGNLYGLNFFTSYISRMSITNDGDVGIGTASPAAKLDVNGGVRATSFAFAAPRAHYYSLGAEDFHPNRLVEYYTGDYRSPYSFYGSNYNAKGAYIGYTSAASTLVAGVHLPQNATVTSFTVFFRDKWPDVELTAALLRCNLNTGVYQEMVWLDSSGVSNLGSKTKNLIIWPTIDNASYSYSVSVGVMYYSYWPGYDDLSVLGAVIKYETTEVE